MPNVLTRDELEYLDRAFPDPRKRETAQPDGVASEALRSAAEGFAKVILQNCPSNADRSAALRDVRSALSTARESLCRELPRV